MVAAVIVGVAVGVGAGAFVSVGTAIALGMAAASLTYALTMELPTTPNTQQENKQTLRSSRPPKNVCVGEFMCSGALLFAEEQPDDSENEDGTYNEWLYLALGICDHPISEVKNIYFNETLLSEFGEKAKVSVKINPSVADPVLLSGAPSWKSDMIGKGTTWISASLLYDLNLYSNGVPTIRLHGLGHSELYDPRTGAIGYSNNAAIVIYNFFHIYMKVPKDRLITSSFGSFVSAANLCDETVINPDDSRSKRYTVNGIFSLSEKPSQVLSDMMLACGATLVRVGGRIGILPAAYYGSADNFTITQSDIIGDVVVQPEVEYGAGINTVSGTFVDPSQFFADIEYPPVVDEAQLNEDGKEILSDTKFRFVTDVYQAQRVASILLKRSVAGATISLRANFNGFRCVVGRVINLDIPAMGISGEYRVSSVSSSLSDGADITLSQEDPDIYDDSVGSPYEPPPLTDLPSSSVIAAPTGLQFLAEQVGEVIQGYLQWKIRAFSSVKTDIRIRKATGGDVVLVGESTGTMFKVNGLLADSYLAEIRSVDSQGRVSDWSSLLFAIGRPKNIDSVKIDASNWNIQLIPIIDEGVPAGTLFEFKHLADNSSFLSGVPNYDESDMSLASTLFTGSSFNHGGLIPDRYNHYWIRSISSYGAGDWFYVRTGTTREQDLVTTVVERLESIEIVSSNYIEGSQGYRIFPPNPEDPSQDGKAEFSNIIARGHIEAKSGTFEGELNSTGVLNAAEIYSSEIFASVIRGSTFIESERLFQVEGNLEYPDGEPIIADYYLSSDMSRSVSFSPGMTSPIVVASNVNTIYPYNYTSSKTQSRMRWSTVGDYDRAGFIGSFSRFQCEKGELGITFTLTAEYEDTDGTIKTAQISAEVSSHLTPYFNNRLWNSPVGNIRFSHTVTFVSGKAYCDISWKSESSSYIRFLRKFTVTIGNPYYTEITTGTVTFKFQAKNYEAKP